MDFVDAGKLRGFRPLDGLGPAAGVTHRVGYSLGVFKEALSGLLLGVVFLGPNTGRTRRDVPSGG